MSLSNKIAAGLLGAALVLTPAVSNARLDMYAEPDYKAHIGWRDSVGVWNMSASNDNTLDSVKNQTPYTASFWKGRSRTGHCWSYGAGVNDPSFWWKDRNTASSYALGYSC